MKTFYQIFKKVFLGIAILFLVSWIALLGIFQTHKGQNWLLTYLTETINTNSDYQIKIEAMDAVFPFSLRFYNIHLFDKKLSPIVTVDNLEIKSNFFKLLKREFVLSSIHAHGVSLNNKVFDVQGKIKGSLIAWKQLFEPHNHDEATLKGHYSIWTTDEQNLKLQGHFAWVPHQTIELPDMLLESSLGTLQGNFKIGPRLEIEEGAFEGTLHDLAFLDPSLKGSIEIQAGVSGSLYEPQVVADLQSQAVLWQDTSIPDLKGIIDFTGLTPCIGQAHVAFVDKGLPLYIQTAFHLDENQVRLEPFKIQSPRSSIQGDLSFQLLDQLWTGLLHVDIDNFSEWSFIPNMPFEGSLQGVVHLLPADNHQTLSCQLDGKQCMIGPYQAEEFHLSLPPFIPHTSERIGLKADGKQISWPGGAIESLYLSGLLTNSLDPYGSWQISLEHLAFGDVKIEALDVSTDWMSDQTAAPFQLYLTDSMLNGLKGSINGNWLYSDKQWNIEVSDLNGQVSQIPVQALQPFKISVNEETQEISQLKLALGQGTIEADTFLNNKEIHCQCKASKIPINLIRFFQPHLAITGDFSLEAELNGTLETPHGKAFVELYQIQFQDEHLQSKPLINGSVDLSLNDEQLQINTLLSGIGNTPIKAAGYLPLKLSLAPAQFTIPEKEIAFQIEAEGELAPFVSVVYDNPSNMTGDLSLHAQVTGTFQNPIVEGIAKYTNGTYESFSSGSLYQNIQATLEGKGTHLSLTQFSAQDNKNGSFQGSGSLDLNKELGFPFKIDIELSDIALLENELATIIASGPITLVGNQNGGKILGQLTSQKATINLDGALPAQIQTVDVEFINLPKDELELTLKKNGPPWPLTLQLALDIPSTLTIDGQHLTSTWKGAINITGTPADVNLAGELRVKEGTLNFNGKIFGLTTGNIYFNGPVDKKTTLYLVGSKEIDRIKADIIIKGPTSQPVISFRSTPPLSQREVLSYILFGKGISDITPDEGDQLSQSFMTLQSTEGSDSDMLGKFRDKIGIDRLEFNGTKDNNDLSLQMGKYITKNILVSVNKSINAPANRVSIEAVLRKNLKAQAEIGDDAQGTILLKWKKDY